jgi:very-short-patch-repair endonuclease
MSHRHALDVDDLVEKYIGGMSEKQLADCLGISRTVIARRLSERGVPRRGRSEAERLKWQAITADPRLVERQCSAAWGATRGSVRSVESKRRHAVTCFQRQVKIGKHETRIATMLAGLGLDVVQQFPVGHHNIDVAIPSSRVAVEVLSHYPKPDGGTVPYRERTECVLGEHGWCVLWIDCTNYREPVMPAVAEHVLALLHRVRRDESVRRRQWVVRCDGERSPGLGRKLEKLTGVPCPNHGEDAA